MRGLKLSIVVCIQFFISVILCAQSTYNIQIKKINTILEEGICYEVSVSANEKDWYLAGQNYRLYYDASQLQFKSGTSLLSTDYQSFTLVQNNEHIDASSAGGCLHYASDLGFLNYSIDLLSTSAPSAVVPADGSWLPTTKLCFSNSPTADSSLLSTLTWGRNTLTSDYAISYVSLSEFMEPRKLAAAIGERYIDEGVPCEPVTIEERNPANSPEDETYTYGIRLVESSNELDNICFQLEVHSTAKQDWYLAGQNYRLFYDANQLAFEAGRSFLGDQYQDFKIVQDVANIDASSSGGCLDFDKKLGFLNYSIDLFDTKEPAIALHTGDNWIATSEICFQKKEAFHAPAIVIGRDELTAEYATSFVELSAWQKEDKTLPARGNYYQDIGNACNSDLVETEEIFINVKVLLQGCYDPTTELLSDDLRKKKLIPLEEPYTNLNFLMAKAISEEEKVDSSVLRDMGSNAVVDWIMIELRNEENPTKIEGTRCALLLRNGLIVDLDGTSLVKFELNPGLYYVAIRHRNHLGVMSEQPIIFDSDKETTLIDFSKKSTAIYGQKGRKEIGRLYCLWGGNADSNSYLIFEGAGVALPDSDQIFFDIFSDEKNSNYNYNFITRGYYASDTNMDGEVIYQGVSNDRDEILFNVVGHRDNEKFYTNFFIKEQIPD